MYNGGPIGKGEKEWNRENFWQNNVQKCSKFDEKQDSKYTRYSTPRRLTQKEPYYSQTVKSQRESWKH